MEAQDRESLLEKAESDERIYGKVTLGNSLEVMLVSDMKANMAAASMTVQAGFFSDPPELPGLAHFLEHMLFLGTAKYPDEGSYLQYISEHGGSANAGTGPEETSYFFSVAVAGDKHYFQESDHSYDRNPFPGALDRFSQFFISPLFSESATTRELNAVESEYRRNFQIDFRRIEQTESARRNDKHPISRFGSGSKASLSEIPQAQQIDVRAALIKFYEEYYSANRMKLCLTGPFSLDELQHLAQTMFSIIENKSVPPASDEYKDIPAICDADVGHTLFVETIRDIRNLSLTWYLPSLRREYRYKSASYVSELLRHEGEGSLYAALKERGWANSLDAGISSSSAHFCIFEITFNLTSKGLDHVDEIVHKTFAFLKLIRKNGIHKWIYDEEAIQSETAFRFSEPGNPSVTARTLSSRMALESYSTRELLTGPFLWSEFDSRGIVRVLDHLSPEKLNLRLAGKFALNMANSTERWYGTRYGLVKIEPRRISKWKGQKLWSRTEFSIRKPNNLLAQNFEILGNSLSEECKASSCCALAGPKKILETDKQVIYYRLDEKFKRPKGNVSLLLYSSVAYESPISSILSSLFTSLVIDGMTEYGYEAALAGLSFSLSAGSDGIYVEAEGYNDRLQSVVLRLSEEMKNFKASPQRFEVVKEQYERGLKNHALRQTSSHASTSVSLLMQSPTWSTDDYLHEFSSAAVSAEALTAFVPRLLSRLRIVSVVTGNVSQDWAKRTCKLVEDNIEFAALPKCETPRCRTVVLPKGCEIITQSQSPNEQDENSAVKVLFQIGRQTVSYQKDVLLELVADIVCAPFFEQLRTQQQLGYVVSSGISIHGNVVSLSFMVQGSVASPLEMRTRIDEFLKCFRGDRLMNLTTEELNRFVESLIRGKRDIDRTMSMQHARYAAEVFAEEYQFHRLQREIAELRKIKKSDVLEFFDTHIASNGTECRRVTALVHGSKFHMSEELDLREKDDEKDCLVVDNANAFRNSCALYPAPGLHQPYPSSLTSEGLIGADLCQEG